jgi:hypothetical protein
MSGGTWSTLPAGSQAGMAGPAAQRWKAGNSAADPGLEILGLLHQFEGAGGLWAQ